MTTERPIKKYKIRGLAAVTMVAAAVAGAISYLGVASPPADKMVRQASGATLLYDPRHGRLDVRTANGALWRIHRIGRATMEGLMADPCPAATVRQRLLYRFPTERCAGVPETRRTATSCEPAKQQSLVE